MATVTSSATKTVTNPHTGEDFVLVQCNTCGGHGTYWRPNLFAWDNCNKCAGWGCLTFDQNQTIVIHPKAYDIPYKL